MVPSGMRPIRSHSRNPPAKIETCGTLIDALAAISLPVGLLQSFQWLTFKRRANKKDKRKDAQDAQKSRV